MNAVNAVWIETLQSRLELHPLTAVQLEALQQSLPHSTVLNYYKRVAQLVLAPRTLDDLYREVVERFQPEEGPSELLEATVQREVYQAACSLYPDLAIQSIFWRDDQRGWTYVFVKQIAAWVPFVDTQAPTIAATEGREDPGDGDSDRAVAMAGIGDFEKRINRFAPAAVPDITSLLATLVRAFVSPKKPDR